jgi:hypothetical protein
MSSKWPASGTTWTVASGMRAPRIRALAGGTMGSSSWLCSSTLWPDSSATHGQVPRVAAPRGGATSRRAVRRARRSSRPPGLFVDRRQCVARLAEATAKAASRRVHPPSSTPRGPPAQLARHSSATPALRHEEQDAVAGRCGRVHGLRETSTISTPGPSPRRVHRMILTGSREYWSGTRTSPSWSATRVQPCSCRVGSEGSRAWWISIRVWPPSGT